MRWEFWCFHVTGQARLQVALLQLNCPRGLLGVGWADLVGGDA